MKNTNKFFIILSLIILLLILFIKTQNLTYIENLNFEHPDFLYIYPKYNFTINKKNKELIHHKKNTIKYKDLNSKKSREIMLNKNKSSEYLFKNGIPTPKSIKYLKGDNNIKQTIKLVEKQLSFPLVVKPVNETKGKGVHLDISNAIELQNVIKKLISKYDELIIEEQIDGNTYRILIVNNKIIDIILRPLPFIIGDGNKTLQKLLDKRNKNQLKNNNYPIYNVNYNFIKKQGFKLNSIIPKNKKVYVTNIANYHNGSNPVIIPIEKVHPDNIKMFLQVNKVLGANISGIDYISKDISKSYKKQGAVIEVNSGPSYKMHDILHPKYKISNDIISQLDKYYNTIF